LGEAFVIGQLDHGFLTGGEFFEGVFQAAGAVDGPWEIMTPADREVVNVILVNFGKLLEAYMRKLVSGASAFDRYVGGEGAALSAAQGVNPVATISCDASSTASWPL